MGRGGMGAVYRGQDVATGDAVAIKVIDRQLVSALERRRFLREGNLLARLSHPAIVRHAGHGAMEDGRLFVAMEWLDGGDLHTRLTQGPLSLDDTLTLATRLCEGLAAVHDAGIVHRDIKPSNVMLPAGELARAKLVDFGVAQAATLHSGKLTQTGAIIGTPGYLAPEQVQGGAVDARADLYTLGLLLYEALTGTAPFVGDNLMALFGRVLFDPLPPLRSARPALPAELEELVARLAHKVPDARPGSARDVLAALASIPRTASGGGKPSPVRTPTRLEQPVVVVVAGAGNERSARTLSTAEATEALADLHALARQHGGSVRLLPQGGVLAAVEREGETAAEQVLKATRLARQLCAWRPEWCFAVVTGRGVLDGDRAYGEAFDRVARVLEAGEPGQTIIDSVTAGLLRGRCQLSRKPADLFMLGREHEQPESGPRLLGKPSPFVGRARELSLLKATLDECAEESAARVVLVLADPGLGKSRLAAELRAQVAQSRGEALELLQVRCDPMRSGSAYAALASALAREAGFAADEALAARRAKLAAHLSRAYAPRPLPSAVCAFMGELVDTPFEAEFEPQLAPARTDPALMADQVKRAFAGWVAQCARQPVLVLVDDMHWMDDASVRLLDAALAAARDAPLCVVCLARPALRARFPNLFEVHAFTELSLSRLSRKAGVMLAEAMLSGAGTPQRIDQLVERSDGNVFFLEELIRFQIDRAGDTLPESVLAMVEARFERIDRDGRLLLRAASVFGETFAAAALHALVRDGMGLSIDVEGWLATLCSMEILALQRASMADAQRSERYGFRHGLLREACYAAWTEVDRAHAHAHAADYLEREGEHDPAVLAEHWERGRSPARAAVHYLEAAKRALRSHDLEGAIRYAERGREGAEGPALAGELELLASEARVWRGEPERAKSGALAALALLPPEHQARAQATATLAEAAALTGGWQSEGRQELALHVQRMLDAAP
ncbi:MAG TPA: protein kinase, partial [Polyangiales bacterium]